MVFGSTAARWSAQLHGPLADARVALVTGSRMLRSVPTGCRAEAAAEAARGRNAGRGRARFSRLGQGRAARWRVGLAAPRRPGAARTRRPVRDDEIPLRPSKRRGPGAMVFPNGTPMRRSHHSKKRRTWEAPSPCQFSIGAQRVTRWRAEDRKDGRQPETPMTFRWYDGPTAVCIQAYLWLNPLRSACSPCLSPVAARNLRVSGRDRRRIGHLRCAHVSRSAAIGRGAAVRPRPVSRVRPHAARGHAAASPPWPRANRRRRAGSRSCPLRSIACSHCPAIRTRRTKLRALRARLAASGTSIASRSPRA